MPKLTEIRHVHADLVANVAAGPPVLIGIPQPAERFALRAGPSKIDGTGVFAGEAVPVRSKIGEMRGELISVREARDRVKQRERIHMVEISAKRAIDASRSDSVLRFVNHSCVPNTVLRIHNGRAEFFALRDIELGEELTANYGESHHGGRLQCRCGAPGCTGRL